jgi:hypothetical protein
MYQSKLPGGIGTPKQKSDGQTQQKGGRGTGTGKDNKTAGNTTNKAVV